ncbi:MAG: TolC family protein, partial [Gloeomargarita sp. GXS_bins_116]
MPGKPLRWWLGSLLVVGISGGAWGAETHEPLLPGQVPGLPDLPPVTPVPPNSPGAQDLRNLPPLLAPLLPEANPLTTPTQPAELEVKITRALTLQQALELAARTNRDLQVARAQIEAARAGLRQAQAALFPTITFQSNFQRSESAQAEIADRATQQRAQGLLRPGRSDGPSTVWDGTLRLTYSLYAGGQRGARIQQAQEQLRQAVLNGVQVAQEVQLAVTNAYYDLQN